MAFPTAKELKQLAQACRKAGIKSCKVEGLEITLAEAPPVSRYKQRKASSQLLVSSAGDKVDPIDTDSLTEDQLLFWSSIDPESDATEPKGS
jgi:hypothetical protein